MKSVIKYKSEYKQKMFHISPDEGVTSDQKHGSNIFCCKKWFGTN